MPTKREAGDESGLPQPLGRIAPVWQGGYNNAIAELNDNLRGDTVF